MVDPRTDVRAVRDASRRMVRHLGLLHRSWRSTGRTQTQCHALTELDLRGPQGVADLAAILQLDKSTTSRVLTALTDAGLVRPERPAADRRQKTYRLTSAGRGRVRRIHSLADTQVGTALDLVDGEDREFILRGLELYASALEKAECRQRYVIRTIRRRDDPGMANVIRTVMPEFGASGPGFSILDPEVDGMSSAYGGERAAFYVVRRGDDVVGGAGIAPLDGATADVCELKKMYFLSEVRGLGIGRELLDRCLDAARERGFRICYLESLERMISARRLYTRAGFRPIDAPMGCTGHTGCDRWYVLDL